MSKIIFGRNPVKEALKSNRNVKEIYIYKMAKGVDEIFQLAKKKAVKTQYVDILQIKKYGEKTQGVVAFCSEIEFVSVLDILNFAKSKKRPPFVLICDRVQDPHNLGAILRTAYAVGVDGVILPKKRSAPINAVVEKASAGAVNFLKIAVVANIVFAIKTLKKNNVFVYVADGHGKNMYDFNFKGAVGLVVGSEGKGALRLIKSVCDEMVKIPMKNPIDSLNVSVAGAVILYEMFKQNSL